MVNWYNLSSVINNHGYDELAFSFGAKQSGNMKVKK